MLTSPPDCGHVTIALVFGVRIKVKFPAPQKERQQCNIFNQAIAQSTFNSLNWVKLAKVVIIIYVGFMQKRDVVISGKHFAKRFLATRTAFTLIEVVISMGIVSFAMVSMVGILPLGLATFKQAMTNTVESQIVQSLTNDILLTDFANLSNVTSQTYSYDNEGKILPVSPEHSAQSVYTATIKLQPINDPQYFPVNFQTTNGGNPIDEAYNVQILITNKTQPKQPHTYSVIIANNNQ